MKFVRLSLSFVKLLDFVKSMLDISDKELARRIGVTSQMMTKWRKGETLPKHDTIILLLDLCELHGIIAVKFDWNSYINSVLAPTQYEMVSECDETTGTVLLSKLGDAVGNEFRVAVSSISPSTKYYEKYQCTSMCEPDLIRYRFSDDNGVPQYWLDKYDKEIANPLATVEDAEEMCLTISCISDYNNVVGLKKWIEAVKANKHLFLDLKYGDMVSKLSRPNHINKGFLRDSILDDPELFEILIEKSAYAYCNSNYDSLSPIVFDSFLYELKYKDNLKRVRLYVDTLFSNQNARAFRPWIDFICDVMDRWCWLRCENKNAIDYILSMFKYEKIPLDKTETLENALKFVDYDRRILLHCVD